MNATMIRRPERASAPAAKQIQSPHYLLFSQARRARNAIDPLAESSPVGRWYFLLESIDGSPALQASDSEPNVDADRLELLAVVRGLEALAQPSRVTLVTPSRYVSRGMRYGLPAWRENGWRWERFGRLVPVKNRDLWQRIDRALEFHRVECRTWNWVGEEEMTNDE